MAQYGEQYMKQEGHQTEHHAQNPIHPTTKGHDIGGTGTNIHSTTVDHDMGGTKTTMGTVAGHGNEEGKKIGVVEQIKEKLPGIDHCSEEHKTSTAASVGGGDGYGVEGEGGHEKKGLMDKIKNTLPGGGNQ